MPRNSEAVQRHRTRTKHEGWDMIASDYIRCAVTDEQRAHRLEHVRGNLEHLILGGSYGVPKKRVQALAQDILNHMQLSCYEVKV